MKKLAVLMASAVLLLVPQDLSAGLFNFEINGQDYSQVSTPLGSIPDFPDTGGFDQHTLSDLSVGNITSISVALNLSGGLNSDIYAYLSHNDSTYAVLLNRSTTGTAFDVTLNSGATDYIQDAPGTGTIAGTWKPDSRSFDPGALNNDNAVGTALGSGGLLSVFNGQDPNGTWTLFLADLKSGNTMSLNSWELSINTELSGVPEPTNVALAIFGLLLVGVKGASWWMDKRATKRPIY